MNRDGRRYGTVTANIASTVSGGATGAWRNVTFRDVKEGWKKKANEPYCNQSCKFPCAWHRTVTHGARLFIVPVSKPA